MTPQDEQTRNDGPSTPGKPTGWPWRFILLLAVLAGGLVFVQRFLRGDVNDDRVAWRDTYDHATQEASQSGKPMLVVFSADWCEPCNQMKARVYSDQAVADAIEAGFVPVRIDMTNPGEVENNLAQRYGVKGIPALLVSRADGSQISMSAGYMNKKELTAWLDQARGRFISVQ